MDDSARITSGSARSTHADIPAEAWLLCSRVLTEGRRMRALAADLRAQWSGGVAAEPSSRHAIEQLVRALETAAALGDVASDALVRPGR